MTRESGWTYEFLEDSSDWCVMGPVSEPDTTGMTFQPAICTLSSSCGEDEARLIAAAPTLLEALDQLLGNAELARFHMDATDEASIVASALFDTIGQARQAISAATGQQETES